MRLRAWMCLVVLASASCAGRVRPTIARDTESARIYSAALHTTLTGGSWPPDSAIWISDSTEKFDSRHVRGDVAVAWRVWRSRIAQVRPADTVPVAELPPDLAADFHRRGSERVALRGRLRVTGPKGPYRFLSERHPAASPPEDTTSHAEELFWGHVVVSFSRVGFSDDGRLALVHIGLRCGGRCGVGKLILLRRAPEGWTGVQAVTIWNS